MTEEQTERLANIDRMFAHAEKTGAKLTNVLSSRQIRFLRELLASVMAGLDQTSLLYKSLRGSCKCGVLGGVSHYCASLDHSWVGKREPPNPDGEHLAPNGKPIDGYPRQLA